MRIQLQAAVPYEQSLLWELHRQYYLAAGAQAFLKQEVPYNISSNPCLAAQAVRLLLASLPDGPAEAPETLEILELGAGLGIFALNFLQALQHQAPALAAQTRYWLTDFSLTGLQTLAEHPAYRPWIQSGQLQLACVDGQQPSQAQDLTGQPLAFPSSGFQFILANYFFSTLPTAVLLKQGERWLRQHCELSWLPLGPEPSPSEQQIFYTQIAETLSQYRLVDKLPPEHPQFETFAALQRAQEQVAQTLQTEGGPADESDFKTWLEQALAEAWQHNLNQDQALNPGQQQLLRQWLSEPLCWRQSYDPDSLQDTLSFVAEPPEAIFASPSHHQLVEQRVRDWHLASVGYSAAGLETLATLLNQTAVGGLLLLSDKAYPDASWMQGLRPELATHHGQSLAHPVNFPLFAALATELGASSLSTSDLDNALHSLLICRNADLPAALKAQFSQDFISHPGNELSHALLEGGHALMQQGQNEQALRCFSKALRYRPSDGTLQYFAAVCHLQQARYAEALALLQQPHDDVFGLLNRSILLAESYRLNEAYAEALPHYAEARRYGANAQSDYNLALCYLALGQLAAASEALNAAAALDPADTEIQVLQQELRAAMANAEAADNPDADVAPV